MRGDAPPPPVLGFAEAVLNVHDLPAMRDFYRDALGFAVHSEVSLETSEPDPGGEPTISFLAVAEPDTPLGRDAHPQLLALVDYRRHVFAKRFARIDPATSPLNHLAFEVPPGSLAAYRTRLEALGLEVFPASFPAMNAEAIFFADPEGNRLELIARAESSGGHPSS